MFTRRRCALVVLVTFAGSTFADIVGGPAKVTSAGRTVRAMEYQHIVSVGPDTVNPELEGALAKQGFSSDNGWNLQYDYSSGSFDVSANFAWAQARPRITTGPYTLNATPAGGVGGAAFAFEYERADTDPTIADSRFVQLIRTNDPLAWGQAQGFTDAGDPGFTYYIDNGYNADNSLPGNPFYGDDDNNAATGYASLNNHMLDRPGRFLVDADIEWEAWAFLSTWDEAQKTITLYDAINWGFTIKVPTPGSLAILALGGVTVARRRRS